MQIEIGYFAISVEFYLQCYLNFGHCFGKSERQGRKTVSDQFAGQSPGLPSYDRGPKEKNVEKREQIFTAVVIYQGIGLQFKVQKEGSWQVVQKLKTLQYEAELD